MLRFGILARPFRWSLLVCSRTANCCPVAALHRGRRVLAPDCGSALACRPPCRFTEYPQAATVRVQIVDNVETADFVMVDDTTVPRRPPAEAHPRFVAISAYPSASAPIIYLSTEGGADYRIFVRSKTFSLREAAALIVGAKAGMPASPPPRSESHLNFSSTMFPSGGVTPRASSTSQRRRRILPPAQRGLKLRETPLATKPQRCKNF